MSKLKICNLYAGIGGNRKLWTDCEVTAVENNPDIAAIYQDFFPDDRVIVGDAHQYLLEHYDEFDFIWSSPPCPSHSNMRLLSVNIGDSKPIYPDMRLYQEIIFLKQYFEGLWVVENVVPFYDYLIRPSVVLDRHPFWSNFLIAKKHFASIMPIKNELGLTVKVRGDLMGFDVSDYKLSKNYDRRQLIKNCVYPPIGQYILDQSKQSPTKQTASMQLSFPMKIDN